MSDFLLTEAIDEDEDEIENEGNDFNSTLSDEEFIDDETQFENNPSDYYGLVNIERSYDDAMQDSISEIDFNQEANNFVSDSDENDFNETKIDNFKDFNERLDKFKKNLYFINEVQDENSFFYAILYGIKYYLKKDLDKVSDDHFRDSDLSVIKEIYNLKDFLKLDLKISTFEDQCYTINHILNKHNLFLRVYEQKEKFRYITNTEKDKKKIIREISSCVKEKFNGFIIVRVDFDNEIQKDFSPIDIVYEPVKNQNEIVNCYFTDKIHLAFRTTYSEGKKVKHTNAFRCYYCTKFFSRRERFEKHLSFCNGKPGYVYNFDTQNILTFEENLKFKHDIPLTAYIDFETTAPTDKMLDPESCKMKAVSYAIIFAFHPKLNFDRIIIERSFGHSRDKLTTIDYLTNEQLKFKDEITLKQLRDSALEVSSK